MPASILHGDCLALLPTLPANSIDAIVTDPPAGISFMGKQWDHNKGGRDQWIAWMQQVAAECLRCMRPGGHALVWALPRTSHWTATAWENAGWEVRDVVHHVFGSGFPKSHSVAGAIDKHLGHERTVIGEAVAGIAPGQGNCVGGEKPLVSIYAATSHEAQQWQGWGTALKPAVENWILLRKPLIGTVAQNVLAHGTGGINVDACRVGPPTDTRRSKGLNPSKLSAFPHSDDAWVPHLTHAGQCDAGRWPPNVCTDGSDEVVGCFPHTHHAGNTKPVPAKAGTSMFGIGEHEHNPAYYPGETDHSTARFFPALGFSDDERRILYCPKASKRDRAGSGHPTIKPQSLMRWLCRLITPIGGTVLDPFAGSGSTGEAAMRSGFDVILIEQDAIYIADIEQRLAMQG